MAAAAALVLRHRRHARRLGQRHVGWAARTAARPPRQPEFLRRPRRASGDRPYVHRRRGSHERGGRGHQRRAVEAAIRQRPRHSRTHAADERQPLPGDRGDAGRIRLPRSRHRLLGPDRPLAGQPRRPQLPLPERRRATRARRQPRGRRRRHAPRRGGAAAGIPRVQHRHRRRRGAGQGGRARQHAARTARADGAAAAVLPIAANLASPRCRAQSGAAANWRSAPRSAQAAAG